jgi:hypothetical protein
VKRHNGPPVEAFDDHCLPSFSPATRLPVSTSPQAVVTADFNNDGRLDLATANAGRNSVSVLLGNGDGTFQAPGTSATGANPVSIAVGDFDADGKLDVAATSNVYHPDNSYPLLPMEATTPAGTYQPALARVRGRSQPTPYGIR